MQNFDRFWCPLFIDFSSILEGFWRPSWLQNPPKTVPRAFQKPLKMASCFCLLLGWIFGWFLIDFGPPRPPQIDATMGRNADSWHSAILLLFRSWMSSWTDFGSQKRRFWLPKSFQNRSQVEQKPIKTNIKNLVDFGMAFWSIFLRFWTHLGSQVGGIWDPCWPPNPFKGHFKKKLKNDLEKRLPGDLGPCPWQSQITFEKQGKAPWQNRTGRPAASAVANMYNYPVALRANPATVPGLMGHSLKIKNRWIKHWCKNQ